MPDILRILLHGDAGARFPTNSTIDGHVELDIKDAADQQKFSHVNVSFQCISFARVYVRQYTVAGSRTRVFRSRSVLFHQFYNIVAGREFRPNGEGGTITWPFQLRVPAHPEPLSQEGYDATGNTLYQASSFGMFPGTSFVDLQHQALPTPVARQISAGLRRLHLTIAYPCRAEIPGMTSGWSRAWIGDKHTEINVPIYTTPISTKIPPVQYNHLDFSSVARTLRLLPDHSDGHLTFREHAKSLFHKSSLPSISLHLTLTAPDHLRLDNPSTDEPLPLKLTIRRLASASYPYSSADGYPDNTIPTPRVLLKQFQLRLVARTDVRAKHPFTDREEYCTSFFPLILSHYENKDLKAHPGGLVGGDSAIAIPVTDDSGHSAKGEKSAEPFHLGRRLDINYSVLQKMIVCRPKHVGLGPDYATPNVVRRYGWEWDIRLDVAGEEVRWEPSMKSDVFLPVQIWGSGVRVMTGPGGGLGLGVLGTLMSESDSEDNIVGGGDGDGDEKEEGDDGKWDEKWVEEAMGDETTEKMGKLGDVKVQYEDVTGGGNVVR